jgi:hypothetical protein
MIKLRVWAAVILRAMDRPNHATRAALGVGPWNTGSDARA